MADFSSLFIVIRAKFRRWTGWDKVHSANAPREIVVDNSGDAGDGLCLCIIYAHEIGSGLMNTGKLLQCECQRLRRVHSLTIKISEGRDGATVISVLLLTLLAPQVHPRSTVLSCDR